jgi:hypothetical protein
MDSSGFGMDEVYRSNVEIRTNTNEEETLQFGDFGSVIVQSAREVQICLMTSLKLMIRRN